MAKVDIVKLVESLMDRGEHDAIEAVLRCYFEDVLNVTCKRCNAQDGLTLKVTLGRRSRDAAKLMSQLAENDIFVSVSLYIESLAFFYEKDAIPEKPLAIREITACEVELSNDLLIYWTDSHSLESASSRHDNMAPRFFVSNHGGLYVGGFPVAGPPGLKQRAVDAILFQPYRFLVEYDKWQWRDNSNSQSADQHPPHE